MSEYNTNEQAFYSTLPWTWRDRLRWKLFPGKHPEVPMPKDYTAADCLITDTRVGFGWADRIRVLLTGKVMVRTQTATEHAVGRCESTSVAFPVSRWE